MNFDFKCPHCGAKYEATPEDMNRNFSCEVCGKNFVVQSVGGTQARPTPQTGSQRKVVIKPCRNAAKGKKVTTKPLRLAVSSRPPFTVLHEPIKPTSQTPRPQTKERETIFDAVAIAFEDAIAWLIQSFWPFVLDVYDAAIGRLKKHLVLFLSLVALGGFWEYHNVKHRRSGRTSAMCPICWFKGSGKVRYEKEFVMLERYDPPDDKRDFYTAMEDGYGIRMYSKVCPHCGGRCNLGGRRLPERNAETKALIKYIFICPWCHLEFHDKHKEGK